MCPYGDVDVLDLADDLLDGGALKVVLLVTVGSRKVGNKRPGGPAGGQVSSQQRRRLGGRGTQTCPCR